MVVQSIDVRIDAGIYAQFPQDNNDLLRMCLMENVGTLSNLISPRRLQQYVIRCSERDARDSLKIERPY